MVGLLDYIIFLGRAIVSTISKHMDGKWRALQTGSVLDT